MWILMALTVTLIGKIGTPGGNTSISFAAYNQIAGHTIAVVTEAYDISGHISSITDTAGNTYVGVFAGDGYTNGGSIHSQVWYAANCASNAANVITVNYSTAHDYSTAAAYDLSGATNIVPDAQVTNNGALGTSAASGSYTTTHADAALFVMASTVSAALTCTAVDSGFTFDGVGVGNATNLTGFAHKVVTTIQTAQVVTFTNSNNNWTTVFVSFSGGAIVAAKRSVIIIFT
jgi:hypothetical protein